LFQDYLNLAPPEIARGSGSSGSSGSGSACA